MACLRTQSLWVTGDCGGGLNYSHVPYDQRSVGDIPTALAHSADCLSY